MSQKKKSKPHPLFDHPLNQLTRGDVLWDDDFVDAMAEGKKPAEPIKWDKILKLIDKNVIKQDEEVRTCEDAIEKACCPKHRNKPFQFFDDATWTSDGEEVKHCNIFCQGTESGPCSQCSEDSQTENPPRKKAKPTNELVEAKGFRKEDHEGEEESPKKMPPNACKWCLLDPCIVDDEETVEEGRMIVNNLIAQEATMKECRHPLCRMCAHHLGCTQKRWILPTCVCNWINEHFVKEGEERTGFKPKQKDMQVGCWHCSNKIKI